MNKKTVAIIVVGGISLGLMGCEGATIKKLTNVENTRTSTENLECAALRYFNKDDIEIAHVYIVNNKESVEKSDITYDELKAYASKSQILVSGLDVEATKEHNEKYILSRSLSIIDYCERNITDSIYSQAMEEISDLCSNNKVVKEENEYYALYLISTCQSYIRDNCKDNVEYTKINESLHAFKDNILNQI